MARHRSRRASTCHSGDPDGPALIGAASIGSRTILSQGTVFKVASRRDHPQRRWRLPPTRSRPRPPRSSSATAAISSRAPTVRIAMSDIIERHKTDDAASARHAIRTGRRSALSRAARMSARSRSTATPARPMSCAIPRSTTSAPSSIPRSPRDNSMAASMQSAGHVFGEDCRYDVAERPAAAGSFMDYVMPRADLVREFRSTTIPCRRPTTRWAPRARARPAPPARLPTCMNAVVDALRVGRRHGIRHAGDAGAAMGGVAAREVTAAPTLPSPQAGRVREAAAAPPCGGRSSPRRQPRP